MNITKDTYCNNKAHVVKIVGEGFIVHLHFSYDTCVGVNYWTRQGEVRVHSNARLENHWGPTTGRHMKTTGCYEFPILDDDAFDCELTEAISQLGLGILNSVTRRMCAAA